MEMVLGRFIIISFVAFIGATRGSYKEKLPDYIRVCNRNAPDLNACVNSSVHALKPYLLKGIPELDLPSYDPLVLPQVKLQQGTRAVNFEAIFTNVTAFGGSQFAIRSLDVNLDKNKMEFELFFPRLRVESHYKVDGNVLLVPVRGDGESLGVYSNITAYNIIRSVPVNRDGDIYWEIVEAVIRIKLGHGRVHFANLFNGNEVIGNAVNTYFNEHFDDLAPEIIPVVEDALAYLFSGMTKKVLGKYPIRVLFPEE